MLTQIPLSPAESRYMTEPTKTGLIAYRQTLTREKPVLIIQNVVCSSSMAVVTSIKFSHIM